MNWRPEDWKEIKQQHPSCTIDYKSTDIFEAGADAMLDVLKKKGRHIRGTDFISHVYDLDNILSDGGPSMTRPESLLPDEILDSNKKHWVVVIPDDEAKDG